MKVKVLILIWFCLYGAHNAFSEEIKLKNGDIVIADIVERTDDYIKVDQGIGIDTTYYLDEIDVIDGVEILTHQDKSDNHFNKIGAAKDQVVLESGEIIEGAIIEFGNDMLRVATGEKAVEIPSFEIKEIVLSQRKFEGGVQDMKLFGDELTWHLKNEEFSNIIVTGLQEENAFIDSINAYYQNEEFAELEKVLAVLQDELPRFLSGEFKIKSFYEGIIKRFGDVDSKDYNSFIKIAEKWKQHYPESIAPYCLIAKASYDKAWFHRGSGFAKAVSKSGWELMKVYMDIFAQEMEEGENIKQKDEYFYYLKSSRRRKNRKSTASSMYYLKKGLAINPLYYDIYIKVATQTLPRWGGYAGQIEEFADYAYSKDPDNWGSFHYAVIADLARTYNRKEVVIKFNFDYEKIREGLLLFHKYYPLNLYWINSLASFSCMYGDQDTAQRAFSVIGGRWDQKSEEVWSKTEFDSCRGWAVSNEDNETNPVLKALANKDYEKLKELKEAGEDLNVRAENGLTPLMLAIWNSNEFLAKKLIRLGADVNAVDDNGDTALHYAANSFFAGVAQMLIDSGADVNVPSQKYNKNTPLHYAAFNGAIEVVKVLLENSDTKVDAFNGNGVTPLYYAASRGHLNVLKVLMEKDPGQFDVADYKGQTPLQKAVQGGYLEIAEYLIEKGARINHQSNEYKTALNYALELGSQSIIDMLKANGSVASDIDQEKVNFERYKKENVLGIEYMRNLRFDEALKQFDLCINIYPSDPAAYYNKFLIIFNDRKDYLQALELINKAIELNPHDALYYYQRGMTYDMLREVVKAGEDFNKSLELKPDSKEAKIINSVYKKYVQ